MLSPDKHQRARSKGRYLSRMERSGRGRGREELGEAGDMDHRGLGCAATGDTPGLGNSVSVAGEVGGWGALCTWSVGLTRVWEPSPSFAVVLITPVAFD